MTTGQHIIGFENSASGTETFHSYNPTTQQNNGYVFFKVTPEEVNAAVEKAATAFQFYRKKSGAEKADFLYAVAEELLNAGDELITVCCEESGLPKARIEGERMRTVNQLKMFAELLKEGSWVDARIDTALPERAPLPRPDIRFMHIAIGPVAVFGASNFPLAFSVAGGDTASALAAGCPVVVKAHPAHPATSALVGKAIKSAAEKTGMPDGVFSLLFDNGIDSGIQLVKHPFIKAVGFTGSYKAGKALFDAAVSRPVPIPVYAEMGSTNPVFILPQAMKERGAQIAAGYSAAVTLGVGQFCTNPGMLIHQNTGDDFPQLLKNEFEKTPGGVMLTPGILNAYNSGVAHHLAIDGVEKFALSPSGNASPDNWATPVLLKTDQSIFSNNPSLSEEVFGPTAMVVPVDSKEAMLDIANNLSGHLTATVHGTADELHEYKDLLDILEQKVGRVIINGFPTGVEVCSAMVHGGPFPSTTDSKTTSVGTAAIYRFTRPVCYQNMPQQMLPVELQDKNTLHIYRLINGENTNKDIN
ncbi:aldehyde dehydrogenase (NADP(+)) [Ferruginibacter sp. HRS2-29]|uniref:aldehyde dehydrogenase (NADP(+)) n=1 Tax=Ferruginibacter sp. HRS2-29 TaxID=2487334 RepID=UPI0020CFA20D|nr:aldehyde dehydrogenase (NADP(+)) [Ferruginibacter sp. HRS2-29]MCP9753445.1 aldehyde dehydrogenase (NADP(+)) [Ferruginibacter sp. HRS2-29]